MSTAFSTTNTATNLKSCSAILGALVVDPLIVPLRRLQNIVPFYLITFLILQAWVVRFFKENKGSFVDYSIFAAIIFALLVGYSRQATLLK